MGSRALLSERKQTEWDDAYLYREFHFFTFTQQLCLLCVDIGTQPLTGYSWSFGVKLKVGNIHIE